MIILEPDSPDPTAHAPYRVTQRVSPRVMIVETAPGVTTQDLQRIDGVAAVIGPGERIDAAQRSSLTATESLFLDAFAQRYKPKERLGEGLSWDASGFLPPDPPHKS